MDPEVPIKSAPDLNMGKITDVYVWAFADGVMKSPKRYDYASSVEPGFGSIRYICQEILNEGERLFKAQ